MLPLSVCEKLLLMAGGGEIAASKIKHAAIDELISEGIITERIAGRTKRTLLVPNVQALQTWLANRHGISSLPEYMQVMRDATATRSDLVQYAADSKAKSVRSFHGFLVNSYQPVHCMLASKPFIVQPQAGLFTFIHNYTSFVPAANVVIVGVENAENFRRIDELKHLFPGIVVLFVSRYPQSQSRDLLKWLMSIPNAYLHFGDFDFAGINIYQQEYKKHLGSRASYFIPYNLDTLLSKYGNSSLYDRQSLNNIMIQHDEEVQQVLQLLHKHKKGLEQESLLITD